MNQLIEDLLDVALIEAGQFKVEFALLPAADLARDAVERQRALVDAAGLTISLEVEPDVRTAWGERRRLLQVFENLIGNAIKFTPSGVASEVGRGTTFFFTIPASHTGA